MWRIRIVMCLLVVVYISPANAANTSKSSSTAIAAFGNHSTPSIVQFYIKEHGESRPPFCLPFTSKIKRLPECSIFMFNHRTGGTIVCAPENKSALLFKESSPLAQDALATASATLETHKNMNKYCTTLANAVFSVASSAKGTSDSVLDRVNKAKNKVSEIDNYSFPTSLDIAERNALWNAIVTVEDATYLSDITVIKAAKAAVNVINASEAEEDRKKVGCSTSVDTKTIDITIEVKRAESKVQKAIYNIDGLLKGNSKCDEKSKKIAFTDLNRLHLVGRYEADTTADAANVMCRIVPEYGYTISSVTDNDVTVAPEAYKDSIYKISDATIPKGSDHNITHAVVVEFKRTNIGWDKSAIMNVGAYYLNGDYNLFNAGAGFGVAYKWESRHEHYPYELGFYLGPLATQKDSSATASVQFLTHVALFKGFGFGLGMKFWESGKGMLPQGNKTIFFSVGYGLTNETSSATTKGTTP